MVGRLSEAKKNKSGAGRPRKTFTPEEFEKLCGMQCTQEEICGWFGFSITTLNRRCREHYKSNFEGVYKKYSQDGKISIRRWQYKHMEKNPAMAMFLGKVVLGQRENAELTRDSVTSGPPLVINYNYGSPPSPAQREEADGDAE